MILRAPAWKTAFIAALCSALVLLQGGSAQAAPPIHKSAAHKTPGHKSSKAENAKKAEKTKKAKPDDTPAPVATEAPPPPYEPQMLRLSEILGSLSFLTELCNKGEGDDWREKMAALLRAEAPGDSARRQRLIASFNSGFHGYELTYRSCTANARTAIARYLDEASRLSHDINYRYGNP